MGDFSAAWLRLREAVDQRSRNKVVAAVLSAAFADEHRLIVVDLGCGAGANLRATAPLLGQHQDWTLIDHDAALLVVAENSLIAWADDAVRLQDELRLSKDGKTITVRFRLCDVAADPGAALTEGTRLVTASAFFDLASPAFIDRLVSVVVGRNAALYSVLSYDGVQTWSPPSALDGRIIAAFNEHQQGDKGFGPAAGPGATALLRNAFDAAGYRTRIGDSPWTLGRDDGDLMAQLADGIAAAVAETGQVDAATMAAWRAVVRHGVRVGHTDLLALPPGSRIRAEDDPAD